MEKYIYLQRVKNYRAYKNGYKNLQLNSDNNINRCIVVSHHRTIMS